MSVSKIISAALSDYELKFTVICRNRGIVIDKVDEKALDRLTAALMDAARYAGGAGLVCY